ncbi:MAG TPA: hypothetical protein DDZ39_06635, partial [Flavobacteriaceae bacterium]|nr:hypothetical protein [Flavobacteriaceae bacterium]
DPLTGEITYTALNSEIDTDVTIEYQVCNTGMNPTVCDTAIITISVINPDTDGDGVLDTQEVIDGTDPNDACSYTTASQVLADVSAAWNDMDCDGDGVTNGTEIVDATDPQDMCDFIPANRTLAASEAWNNGDCDGDTVSNGNEWNPKDDGNGPDDTDRDGIFDFLDIDDDNDGVNTIDEDADGNNDPMTDDCDKDGLADYLDPDACAVEIPTLFTPNGDGTNDTFEIPGLVNLYPKFELKIFNRWGNIVYDYHNNGNLNPKWWDGFSTGRMTVSGSERVPTGTYFYIINFNDGKRKPESGWIYLNR